MEVTQTLGTSIISNLGKMVRVNSGDVGVREISLQD